MTNESIINNDENDEIKIEACSQSIASGKNSAMLINHPADHKGSPIRRLNPSSRREAVKL